MKQLNQLESGLPINQIFQQHTGTDSFQISSATESTSLAKLAREQFENEESSPMSPRAVLSVVHSGEIENQQKTSNAETTLQQYKEELRQLSTQLLTIQENERQRIAADLHDGIGQSLSLIKLSLESVTQQINAGERLEAVESLHRLSHKVKETMHELRRTSMDLRPPMLDDLGIVPTLSWFLREFESAWRGKKIEKDVRISESDVPVPLRTTIFRIVQEAINNIVKHASADWIRIGLNRTDGLLQLSIEDNGCGFDLNRASVRCSTECCSSGCGLGLLTMKERARSSGGILDLQSSVDSGTRIFISWRFTDDSVKNFTTTSTRDNHSHACHR